MSVHSHPFRQRGGFLIGLVVGLLVGLGVALAVALYVTKAPNPFVNKVPGRPAAQEAAEAERNRTWDPNGTLAGRNPAPGTAKPGALPASAAEPVRPVLVAPTVIDPVLPAASAPKPVRLAASAASGAAVAAASGARGSQSLSTAASPFSYFVQAGAYSRSEDAEQQRAKLAMMGVEARLTEREQGGRMVYRVRVGPFDRRDEAESAKEKLNESGVDSALVAVQK